MKEFRPRDIDEFIGRFFAESENLNMGFSRQVPHLNNWIALASHLTKAELFVRQMKD